MPDTGGSAERPPCRLVVTQKGRSMSEAPLRICTALYGRAKRTSNGAAASLPPGLPHLMPLVQLHADGWVLARIGVPTEPDTQVQHQAFFFLLSWERTSGRTP